MTSLACGAILDLGFARYAGKGQGEISVLRRVWGALSPGDVLLADSLLSKLDWLGRAFCPTPANADGGVSR